METPCYDLLTSVDLPPELLIHIFKLTCILSHDTALRVSLVSSWVRDLVKPYVFGTVLRRAGSLYPIQGHVELSHKIPPPGCGEYVRNLWLETVDILSPFPREISLFKSCPNVKNVALSDNSLCTLLGLYANPYSNPGHSAIRSLTLINSTPRTAWLVNPRRIFLDNITHLRMVDLQQSPYVPLEYLPNLTHLALPLMHLRATNSDTRLLRIPENTTNCPHLKTIVLTVDHYDWLYRPWLHKGRYTTSSVSHGSAGSPREEFRAVCHAAKAKDSRIYILLSPTIGPGNEHTTVCAEWARASRGGESIWEAAARLSKDDSQLQLLPSVYPKPRM